MVAAGDFQSRLGKSVAKLMLQDEIIFSEQSGIEKSDCLKRDVTPMHMQ